MELLIHGRPAGFVPVLKTIGAWVLLGSGSVVGRVSTVVLPLASLMRAYFCRWIHGPAYPCAGISGLAFRHSLDRESVEEPWVGGVAGDARVNNELGMPASAGSKVP